MGPACPLPLPPQGFTPFLTSASRWGPRIQTQNPVGDIPKSSPNKAEGHLGSSKSEEGSGSSAGGKAGPGGGGSDESMAGREAGIWPLFEGRHNRGSVSQLVTCIHSQKAER